MSRVYWDFTPVARDDLSGEDAWVMDTGEDLFDCVVGCMALGRVVQAALLSFKWQPGVSVGGRTDEAGDG